MNLSQLVLAFFMFLDSLSKSSSPPIPPLSLESIFSEDKSWLDRLEVDKTITLITTGDVIPGRSVNLKMTNYGNFTYPFAKTADFLKNADITLINLEAPLVPDCPVTDQGMVFCGNQRFMEGLKFAGIDVANLANNHSLNWGEEGFGQTVDLLEQNEILPSSSSFSIKPVKGLRLGFLGFNILDNPNLEEIQLKISQGKRESDFLIVSFHWGAEYQRLPAGQTIALAHRAIDSGADLIVGNHPHWWQPLELYKDKLVIYAHGNFVFDQEWSKETKTGLITKSTIYQDRLVDTQIFPIFIQDYCQPFFLEGEEKAKIIGDLKNNSYRLFTTPEISLPPKGIELLD